MSERVERRLYELLEHPTESPYGNPIPGLEALGGLASQPFPRLDVNLLAGHGRLCHRLARGGQPARGAHPGGA